MTLTFRDHITDIDKANYKLNLFAQRAKDRWKEFQYLAVPEDQKSGRVHYHLLCNLRYVPAKEIEKVWKNGFIKVNRVDKVSNLGAYVCKYLQKDMFDKRMFGKKKFFCSQDLKKPTEKTNYDAQTYMQNNSGNLKLNWETTFNDEHRGNILYKTYSLKKCTS
ncbi:MAG: hypothetical protein PHF35_03725 [Candidatus Moranbacteria bacterium]|nr:hypothetical protein [Candidatus Moranbacteria bacterium]